MIASTSAVDFIFPDRSSCWVYIADSALAKIAEMISTEARKAYGIRPSSIACLINSEAVLSPNFFLMFSR